MKHILTLDTRHLDPTRSSSCGVPKTATQSKSTLYLTDRRGQLYKKGFPTGAVVSNGIQQNQRSRFAWMKMRTSGIPPTAPMVRFFSISKSKVTRDTCACLGAKMFGGWTKVGFWDWSQATVQSLSTTRIITRRNCSVGLLVLWPAMYKGAFTESSKTNKSMMFTPLSAAMRRCASFGQVFQLFRRGGRRNHHQRW